MRSESPVATHAQVEMIADVSRRSNDDDIAESTHANVMSRRAQTSHRTIRSITSRESEAIQTGNDHFTR